MKIHKNVDAEKAPLNNFMPVTDTSASGSIDVGTEAGIPVDYEFVRFQPSSFLTRTLPQSDNTLDGYSAGVLYQPFTERMSSSTRSYPMVRFTESNFGGEDLEPRKIEHIARVLPTLRGSQDNNVLHDSVLQRQERCFSLLEAYSSSGHADIDTKASFSNVVQNVANANAANSSRLIASAPYVNSNPQQIQGLFMFDGTFGANNRINGVDQRILPTVIESGRLSMGVDFNSDFGLTNPMELGNSVFFMPRNNFVSQRMEAEFKVPGVEEGDNSFSQRQL
jgi:hypothetical protein